MKKIIYFLSLLVFYNATAQTQAKVPKYTKITVGGNVAPTEPVGPVKGTQFQFINKLDSNVFTSAGIYQGEKLIRTLWGNKYQTAGTHIENWEALTDEMEPITSAAGLTVKRLSHNITTTYEGGIGNTSLQKSGESVLRAIKNIECLAITDTFILIAKGNSEKTPTTEVTSTLNPNGGKIIIKPDGTLKTSLGVRYVCTDGVNAYWCGTDSWAPAFGPPANQKKTRSFVIGTKIGDNSQVIFSAGAPKAMGTGYTYSSVIGLREISVATGESNASILRKDSLISTGGIAVQTTGSYLFVSYPHIDSLIVFNKTSGQVVRRLFVPGAASLATDSNDKLWIVSDSGVQRFSVLAGGNLSSPEKRLTGLVGAFAIGCDKVNGLIAVCDKDDRVKCYNSNSGASAWILGTVTPYKFNAKVQNDRFYFSDPVSGYKTNTFVAFAQDGSFWVGDPGNSRSQHFSANRSYIEQMAFVPKCYSAGVDANDPTRVLANFLEFKVDYSKVLSPTNGSWQLANNWGYGIPSSYSDTYFLLKGTATLSNGRTYSTLRKNGEKDSIEIVELVTNGVLRFTGKRFNSLSQLYPDGSIRRLKPAWGAQLGEKQQSFIRTLTGFSGNDPVFSGETLLGESPNTTYRDPLFQGNDLKLAAGDVVGNRLIYSNAEQTPDTVKDAYHLGAIDLANQGSYLWRAWMSGPKKYTGPYPTGGIFDEGNGKPVYRASRSVVIDLLIFLFYHGEFWKQSQTDEGIIYYYNGLVVTEYGTTRLESPGYAAEGIAGNAFSISVVKVGNIYYVYLNDEGHGGKVHRYKFTGMESIFVQTITPYLVPASVTSNLALGKDVPRDVYLLNNLTNWVRYPAAEKFTNINEPQWTVATQKKAYDRFASPDLTVAYRSNVTGDTAKLYYDLGNQSSTSWQLTGSVLYDDNYPNVDPSNLTETGLGGQFLQVRDYAGKVIFRMFPYKTNSSIDVAKLYVNNTVLISKNEDSMNIYLSQWRDLSVKLNSGSFNINFGSYSTTVSKFDPAADETKPKTVELYFWYKGLNYRRTVSIKDFIFKKQ